MLISFKDLPSSTRTSIVIACMARHKQIPADVFVETKRIGGKNIVTYYY